MSKLNPFAKPLTVDGVLASFRKTVDDLHTIVAERGAERDEISLQIQALRAAQDAAVSEAVQASSIATKLEALIS